MSNLFQKNAKSSTFVTKSDQKKKFRQKTTHHAAHLNGVPLINAKTLVFPGLKNIAFTL